MKKKVLFLIPNLKQGGAEKVLVNLVNNLNTEKYDITVKTLFNVGIHIKALDENVRYIPGYKKLFRGNTFIIKMIPAKLLWKLVVKEHYDIAISYLEGPTARVLSGCTDEDTKKVAWIHTVFATPTAAAIGFRNVNETQKAFNSFDRIITVSREAKECFENTLDIKVPIEILYNTNETEKIQELSKIEPSEKDFLDDSIRVCSVGRLIKIKGFDRLINAHKRLLDDNIKHRVYILGNGEEENNLRKMIKDKGVQDTVTLLGFKENPYQYTFRCDLYVCSSQREGFSTAVTESLILGTPVVSTNCAGSYELLGENNEYGIVTENSEEGIYDGMKKMLSNPELLAHYKEKAKERGSFFSRTKTVQAVEDMLDNL